MPIWFLPHDLGDLPGRAPAGPAVLDCQPPRMHIGGRRACRIEPRRRFLGRIAHDREGNNRAARGRRPQWQFRGPCWPCWGCLCACRRFFFRLSLRSPFRPEMQKRAARGARVRHADKICSFHPSGQRECLRPVGKFGCDPTILSLTKSVARLSYLFSLYFFRGLRLPDYKPFPVRLTRHTQR